MRHVCPVSPVNTKGEFSHVMSPYNRVTHVNRQNSLNEPVIYSAGDKGGMRHRVDKKKVPVVPGGSATEKNAEGLDRADRGMREGRKRDRRRTASCRLIFIQETWEEGQRNGRALVHNGSTGDVTHHNEGS